MELGLMEATFTRRLKVQARRHCPHMESQEKESLRTVEVQGRLSTIKT